MSVLDHGLNFKLRLLRPAELSFGLDACFLVSKCDAFRVREFPGSARRHPLKAFPRPSRARALALRGPARAEASW